MKLDLINKDSVKKISNMELVSLHRRIHQLLALNNKRTDLKKIHNILVMEMRRRKFLHQSDVKKFKEISRTWQT